MAIPARPFSPLFKTLELELISIDLPAEAHRTVMDDQQYVQVGIASDALSIGLQCRTRSVQDGYFGLEMLWMFCQRFWKR